MLHFFIFFNTTAPVSPQCITTSFSGYIFLDISQSHLLCHFSWHFTYCAIFLDIFFHLLCHFSYYIYVKRDLYVWKETYFSLIVPFFLTFFWYVTAPASSRSSSVWKWRGSRRILTRFVNVMSCPIRMSHVPYEWVMSHLNEACHIRIRCVSYERDVFHMKEVCF